MHSGEVVDRKAGARADPGSQPLPAAGGQAPGNAQISQRRATGYFARKPASVINCLCSTSALVSQRT